MVLAKPALPLRDIRTSTEATRSGPAAVVSGRLYGYGLDKQGVRMLGVSATGHAGGGGDAARAHLGGMTLSSSSTSASSYSSSSSTPLLLLLLLLILLLLSVKSIWLLIERRG